MPVRPTRFSIWALQLTALIKPKWCFLLYCCACLHPNAILMEAGWTTVLCPATNISILTRKSSARTKQSVISVALKTPLEIKLWICIHKTSLLHRPNNQIGFTPSCPLTFYNKIAPMDVCVQVRGRLNLVQRGSGTGSEIHGAGNWMLTQCMWKWHEQVIQSHRKFLEQWFSPLTTKKDNRLACMLLVNSPAAAAREVFKPSTDSASLVVPSQKKFSVLGLGFSWGVSQVGVFSRFYGLLYPALNAHRMGPHFCPNIFMKLGYLTSL